MIEPTTHTLEVPGAVLTYDARHKESCAHADDVHRLIAALGGRPVDLFASSAGAVVALALVARYPELAPDDPSYVSRSQAMCERCSASC